MIRIEILPRKVAALLVIMLLAVLNISAQTFLEDFETYGADQLLCTGAFWYLADSTDNCNAFEVIPYNVGHVLHSESNAASTVVSDIPSQSGIVDIYWKWMSLDSVSRFAIGPVKNSGGGSDSAGPLIIFDSTHISYQIGANSYPIAGQQLEDSTWYNMLLRVNCTENSFSLFLSTNPHPEDFPALVQDIAIGQVDSVSSICIENLIGKGLIDDIFVRPYLESENLESWNYSMQIVINTTVNAANIIERNHNVPLMITLSSENFNFSQVNVNGDDIRFVNSKGFQLPFEIPLWDIQNENAVLWVHVPLIEGYTNTDYIKMYWGKSAVGGRSDSYSVFTKNNGFSGVWHFDQNAVDATPYQNNGTISGASIENGIIGKSVLFNGNSDYITVNDTASLDLSGDATAACWIHTARLDEQIGIISKKDNTASNAYSFFLDRNQYICVRLDTINTTIRSSISAPIAVNEWNHVGFSIHNNEVRFFFNGEQIGEPKDCNAVMKNNDQPLTIGMEGNDDHFDGFIDELVLLNESRSNSWIKLIFENQREEQQLLEYGQIRRAINNPSDVIAQLINNEIRITWNDNTNIESGYYIKSGNSRENMSVLDTLPANTEMYMHTNLHCDEVFYYSIIAFNDSVESNEIFSSTPVYTMPCVPTNVAVTPAAPSDYSVSWDGNAGLYILEAKGGISDEWNQLYAGTQKSHIHANLGCSEYWEYRVKAGNLDSSLWSAYSDTVGMTTTHCPIEAPIALTIDSLVPGVLKITWQNVSERTLGFRIYRKDGSNVFQRIDEVVGKENTEFFDNRVRCATSYEYYVTAFDLYVESDSSGHVSATTLYCGAGAQSSEWISVDNMYLEGDSPYTGTKPLVLLNLFSSKTDTIPVFSETFQNVIVKNGLLKLNIGITQNVVNTIRSFENIYYDIIIEGSSIFESELQPLTASPYSIKSSYAFHGEGSPTSIQIDAPIGATYVDTENKELYIKSGVATSDWEKVE